MKRFAAIALVFWSVLGWAGPSLKDLSEGTPALLGKGIAPEGYAKIETTRIPNAKVVWINRELLRNLGYSIPDGPLSPALEKEVLDAFAYRAPAPNETPPSDAIKKTFYADRYGGSGMGSNAGSGRAASAGQIQIKGIGRTALVSTDTSFDHAHGGASLEEGIREAIWGEVNAKRLPYGSNRIVALIDSRDATEWKDGGKEARALIVRMDALRPAHYADAWTASVPVVMDAGGRMTSDEERVTKNLTQLANALPQSPDTEKALHEGKVLPDSEKIKLGLKEFSERLGTQYASAYAQGFYHGTVSTSNIELNGAFLDFGTETIQKGFGPIKILNHSAEAGDAVLPEAQSNIIGRLDRSARSRFCGQDLACMPSNDDTQKWMEKSYASTLKREFLNLTGTAPEIIERLHAENETERLSQALLDFKTINRASAEAVNVDKHMPARIEKWDLRAILVHLANHAEDSDAQLEASIIHEMKTQHPSLPMGDADKKAVRELARAYAQFQKKAFAEAQRQGLERAGYLSYLRHRAQLVNETPEELIRSEMQATDQKLISNYARTKDVSEIARSIDERVALGTKLRKESRPWVLRTRELDSELEITHDFDAKNGLHSTEVKGTLADGHLVVGNERVPIAAMKNGRMSYTLDNWIHKLDAPIEIDEAKGTFRFVTKPSHSPTGHMEFLFHDEAKKIWLKRNGKNFARKVPQSAVPVSAKVKVETGIKHKPEPAPKPATEPACLRAFNFLMKQDN